MDLIKCKECGNIIENGDTECSKCLTPINNNEVFDYNEETSEYIEKKQTKSSTNTINIIISLIIVSAGLYLLCKGINYEIPSKSFSFYEINKYVGGDAYNAIIEAGLRGGEISGATISKTIYICSGIITISLGYLGLRRQ